MKTKSSKNILFVKKVNLKELYSPIGKFIVVGKFNPKQRNIKVLIVYDSVYGNTRKIAQTIASSIRSSIGIKLIHVKDYTNEELKSIKLLVVGSPTFGGRPTKAIQNMVNKIPAGALKGIQITAFDTRISMFIAKIFGWAADRVGDTVNVGG